jgi:hypothetical protein
MKRCDQSSSDDSLHNTQNPHRVFFMLARLICMVFFTCWLNAYANSYELSLPDKIQYCAVVAEIRVDRVKQQQNPQLKMDELVCNCTIIQSFKLPSPTNSMTLTFNYMDKSLTYEGKTFVVFAFDHVRGYRPFAGQGGLIEKGHPYNDFVPPKTANGSYAFVKLEYDALINQIKEIVKATKASQPTGTNLSSQTTNQTSSVTNHPH